MRSLFVKVFLWFWLATTLSGLALSSSASPPRADRRRSIAGA